MSVYYSYNYRSVLHDNVLNGVNVNVNYCTGIIVLILFYNAFVKQTCLYDLFSSYSSI